MLWRRICGTETSLISMLDCLVEEPGWRQSVRVLLPVLNNLKRALSESVIGWPRCNVQHCSSHLELHWTLQNRMATKALPRRVASIVIDHKEIGVPVRAQEWDVGSGLYSLRLGSSYKHEKYLWRKLPWQLSRAGSC